MPSATLTWFGAYALPDQFTYSISFLFNFIPTGLTITDITVSVDIGHPYSGDLDISLSGPNGTSIDLSSDNGGVGIGYVGTTFTDGASTSITAGTPPFTGEFRPETALSTLYSGNGPGYWHIHIADDAAGDTGTIRALSLTIDFDYSGTVIGTAGNDKAGDAGALFGSEGADRMYGLAGDDFMLASDGNDTLFGGAGHDTLIGGDGADILTGDAGRDLLFGSGGKDIFDFNRLSDTTKNVATCDQIGDFLHLTDRIDVKTIDANIKLAGNQTFKFIGTQAFHKVAGELRYKVVAGDAYVSGDVNGDGKDDFVICVQNALVLTKGDFIL